VGVLFDEVTAAVVGVVLEVDTAVVEVVVEEVGQGVVDVVVEVEASVDGIEVVVVVDVDVVDVVDVDVDVVEDEVVEVEVEDVGVVVDVVVVETGQLGVVVEVVVVDDVGVVPVLPVFAALLVMAPRSRADDDPLEPLAPAAVPPAMKVPRRARESSGPTPHAGNLTEPPPIATPKPFYPPRMS
jgi:hypothetical protein